MIRPNAPKVRAFLRANPYGATLHEISAGTGIRVKSLRNLLLGRPDTYVDRWAAPVRGQYQAVWCVVVPPEHCPRPDDRPVTTRWVRAHYLPMEMRA